MRVFWTIVGVLVVLSAAVLVGRRERAPVVENEGVSARETSRSVTGGAPVEAARPPMVEASRGGTDHTVGAGSGGHGAPDDLSDLLGGRTLDNLLGIEPEDETVEDLLAREGPVDPLRLSFGDEMRAAGLGRTERGAGAAFEPERRDGAGDGFGTAPGAAGDPLVGRVEQRPDGTLLVSERFVVAGAGTPENPYILNWDLLLSVQELYKPRLGQEKLPEWAEFFRGKWVKLAGFVAVPITSGSATEILLMRNQWDGCCIGVPPTPYDSLEVVLNTAAPLGRQTINYGSVQGKLTLDPYLWKGWLISLYGLEEAVVELTGF